MQQRIYKILSTEMWRSACEAGVFKGVPVDLEDGFIHFSTSTQMVETATRHFAGQSDLVLVEFAAESFGAALKWEPSRGGDLFPHLYAELDPEAATREWPLPLGSNGHHRFPADLR